MPYFVFVEFLEPSLTHFLVALRQALQGELDSTPIHVTLRGPYATPPNADRLQKYSDLLRGNGVRIGGAGYFATPKGFTAFVRAECSVFRNLWDKPDYRVPLDSIQPHITLYETINKESAKRVVKFLQDENILIYTCNVGLSVYTSRQEDLFGSPIVASSDDTRATGREVWNVRDGILERARTLASQL